ncbi:M28 family peptidase [Pedobacter sp. SYP-B3415]|uniref:M28 family peptidase n=1 Tax=Pedobacter sp. SYP-B3415 TaxID=2496641 RepID=UPI00101DBBAB|nr:M28 family peptidase [Pedobacter sp. SYP-B3415]
MKKIKWLLPALTSLALAACNNEPKKSQDDTAVKQEVKLVSPEFDADSAYAFAKAQVDFGPRIPSTKAHADCAAYLQNKLRQFGADVSLQTGTVKTYDGKSHQLKNILASFNKERKARVLVTAHWDARPFSDQDPDSTLRNKPFDAANDGASGVAVILEMARQIQQKQPNVGVDFILWDLEDYGEANDSTPEELTWCLGSQFWAKSALAKANKPLYGINLDMVGGGNAQFTQDEVSRQYAGDVVKKVWDIGNEIGYASYFVYITSGRLIDDHVWVNKAGIPCIDIIHYSDNAGFYINWHTQLDNMANLDKNTLKAAGQTVLETIYREQPAP